MKIPLVPLYVFTPRTLAGLLASARERGAKEERTVSTRIIGNLVSTVCEGPFPQLRGTRGKKKNEPG